MAEFTESQIIRIRFNNRIYILSKIYWCDDSNKFAEKFKNLQKLQPYKNIHILCGYNTDFIRLTFVSLLCSRPAACQV